jgi:hypothetical protein
VVLLKGFVLISNFQVQMNKTLKNKCILWNFIKVHTHMLSSLQVLVFVEQNKNNYCRQTAATGIFLESVQFWETE